MRAAFGFVPGRFSSINSGGQFLGQSENRSSTSGYNNNRLMVTVFQTVLTGEQHTSDGSTQSKFVFWYGRARFWLNCCGHSYSSTTNLCNTPSRNCGSVGNKKKDFSKDGFYKILFSATNFSSYFAFNSYDFLVFYTNFDRQQRNFRFFFFFLAFLESREISKFLLISLLPSSSNLLIYN